jgi:hypothetical protein
MRSILVLPFLLAACNASSEAETPSSMPGQRSFGVRDFNAVALGGRHNVVVREGKAYEVRAEGPEEVLEDLEIEVRGHTLRIEERHRRWGRGERGTATIFVTAPAIEAASIGGSGDISIDKVSGSRFAASIGGSGDIAVGEMRVEDATFSIAGSGKLTVAGRADSVKLSIAGSGDIDAVQLASRTAHVSVAGSGDAALRASEAARVSLVGSGDVTIHGNPKCSVSRFGSGNVHCRA